MLLIYKTFYNFFRVVEIILLIYIVMSFFPQNNWFRKKTAVIANPLLEPIRFLLSDSIFKSNVADFSPLISFIIVDYLQQILYVLM